MKFKYTKNEKATGYGKELAKQFIKGPKVRARRERKEKVKKFFRELAPKKRKPRKLKKFLKKRPIKLAKLVSKLYK